VDHSKCWSSNTGYASLFSVLLRACSLFKCNETKTFGTAVSSGPTVAAQEGR
jgi:hypothetical protein